MTRPSFVFVQEIKRILSTCLCRISLFFSFSLNKPKRPVSPFCFNDFRKTKLVRLRVLIPFDLLKLLSLPNDVTFSSYKKRHTVCVFDSKFKPLKPGPSPSQRDARCALSKSRRRRCSIFSY